MAELDFGPLFWGVGLFEADSTILAFPELPWPFHDPFSSVTAVHLLVVVGAGFSRRQSVVVPSTPQTPSRGTVLRERYRVDGVYGR